MGFTCSTVWTHQNEHQTIQRQPSEHCCSWPKIPRHHAQNHDRRQLPCETQFLTETMLLCCQQRRKDFSHQETENWPLTPVQTCIWFTAHRKWWKLNVLPAGTTRTTTSWSWRHTHTIWRDGWTPWQNSRPCCAFRACFYDWPTGDHIKENPPDFSKFALLLSLCQVALSEWSPFKVPALIRLEGSSPEMLESHSWLVSLWQRPEHPTIDAAWKEDRAPRSLFSHSATGLCRRISRTLQRSHDIWINTIFCYLI